MILALIVSYASFYAILALLGSSVEAFVVNRPSTKTSGFSRLKMGTKPGPSSADEEETKDSVRSRRDLWKEIGSLERQAVDVLTNSAGDSAESRKEAFKLLSKSVGLKKSDTFLLLANQYVDASEMKGDAKDADDILEEMYKIGLPPHIKYIVSQRRSESGIDRVNSSNSKDDEISSTASDADGSNEPTGSTEKKKGADLIVLEEIDEESTFSEQVTEKIRIRVQSFYDDKESDPANGQYMFRYKVAVFNEGPEAVQVCVFLSRVYL